MFEMLKKQEWYVLAGGGLILGIVLSMTLLNKKIKPKAKGESYASFREPANELYDGELDDTGDSLGYGYTSLDDQDATYSSNYRDTSNMNIGDAYGDVYGDAFSDFDADTVNYML